MKKVFSPSQIKVATFIGGPMAAAYFLKKAFESIDKSNIAKRSFYISLLVTIIVIFTLPLLPERTPNHLIPILYLIPVVAVLNKYYMTKEEIENSDNLLFESNWKVFGLSCSFAALFIVLGLGVFIATETDDNVAQRVANNINSAKVDLNAAFIKLEASKDVNGAGVILDFTVNNNYRYVVQEENQDVLRTMSINFIGENNLQQLASNNIYFIINFQSLTGELLNSVTLTPPNY